MDHLPEPRRPTRPPLQVANLSIDEFDGGPFDSYPQRKGYTDEEIQNPHFWSWKTGRHTLGDQIQHITNNIVSADIEEMEVMLPRFAFLQTWLYFGLLKSVLGPGVPTTAFIRNDGNGFSCITTAHLSTYTVPWITRQRQSGRRSQRKEQKRVKRILGIVLSTLKCVTLARLGSIETTILVSIGILHEALLYATKMAWSGDPVNLNTWDTPDIANDAIGCCMVINGWCPSEIKVISKFSPSLRYFASRLERPRRDRDHSHCTFDRCTAFEVKDQAWEIKHTSNDCTCDHIHANQDQICKVLESGTIPLIIPLARSQGWCSVDIIAYTPNTKYVAISHVWSDGLGNPSQNSLPLCQLKRLSTLVQDLYSPTYPETERMPFWIDTICCPTTPEESKNLAIAAMRKTYQYADRVLVLDSYLQEYTPEVGSELNAETLFRIFLSQWTRRLWTLQEGALARQLYFQLGNCIVNFEDLPLNVSGIGDNTLVSIPLIHLKLAILVPKVAALISSEVYDGAKHDIYLSCFEMVSTALSTRFASIPTDEAICLATLLGLSMEKILEVDPSQRMKCFWSLQPIYSKNLVFWEGKTLPDKGFRWAPASFLGSLTPALPLLQHCLGSKGNENTAQRLPSGLVITFQGLVFTSSLSLPFPKRFWLKDLYGGCLHLIMIQGDRDPATPCEESVVTNPNSIALMFWEFESPGRLSHQKYKAFLVFIRRKEEDMLQVTKGPQVLVFANIHPRNQTCLRLTPITPQNTEDAYDGEYEVVECVWSRRNQIWCFD